MKNLMQQQKIKNILKEVDAELERLVNVDDAFVRECALNTIRAGGKRLRPIFVILSAQYFGVKNEDIVKFASIMELVHTASLIHDDVNDNSDLRRGRPTINATYDNNVAVHIGVYILIEALKKVYEVPHTKELLQILTFIVFAATDDAALNKAIAAYCDAARILVNAITDPQNGNFSVQAEIPRDRYAVSVSTYGQGPGFAKALREYLEPVLDERLDLAVEVYIGVRQWLLASVDDPKLRQAQMRRLSLKRIYELIDAGITDHDELSERVKEWLSCSLD